MALNLMSPINMPARLSWRLGNRLMVAEAHIVSFGVIGIGGASLRS